MICFLENILLQHRRFNLIIIQNDIFSQRLHCKHSLCIFLLYKKNFTKTAFSNYFFDFKCIQTRWYFIFLKTSLENCHCATFHEFGIGLIHLRLMNIKRRRWCRNRCLPRLFRINIFCLNSCIFKRLDFSIFLDISLFRGKFIYTIFNGINWQISLFDIPEVIFYLFKYIIPLLRVELIIVLTGNVYDETGVTFWVEGFGEGFDAVERSER